MDEKEINILSLAYLGDSVYELNIRKNLINKKIYKVNDLQSKALEYVTAKKQCYYINKLIDNDLLNDIELDIVKRGRNAKVSSHPKNTDIVTYKWATGLECLFGYLYIKEDKERINELIRIIMED